MAALETRGVGADDGLKRWTYVKVRHHGAAHSMRHCPPGVLNHAFWKRSRHLGADMNRFLIVLAATILCVSAWASSAQAVSFQLIGSAAVEAVDEAASFSLTAGGITATLAANV